MGMDKGTTSFQPAFIFSAEHRLVYYSSVYYYKH